MQSSLGFHTITLSKLLLDKETKQLTEDFVKYSRKERYLQMYPDKNGNWVIKFYPMDIGIRWKIRRDVWINESKMFFDIINVTINPKILADTHDYITAATYQDMDIMITSSPPKHPFFLFILTNTHSKPCTSLIERNSAILYLKQ